MGFGCHDYRRGSFKRFSGGACVCDIEPARQASRSKYSRGRTGAVDTPSGKNYFLLPVRGQKKFGDPAPDASISSDNQNGTGACIRSHRIRFFDHWRTSSAWCARKLR
tara:strand:+ start:9335 stop:9658 length:324 start_codon:yes stop_codon:yes gene_type:complete